MTYFLTVLNHDYFEPMQEVWVKFNLYLERSEMTNFNIMDISPNSSELAQYWVEQGYSIFPVGYDKKPHRGYKWRESPITNVEEIKLRWSGGNKNAAIGIVTGKISNLLVLDIDNKNGGNGSDSLKKLEQEYGALPETYTVQTPSGGYHYYFKYNDCGLTIDAGVLDGIDYRGEGGYVVSAGSLIKDGAYTEICNALPAEVPEWLINVLNRKTSSRRSVQPVKKESGAASDIAVGGRNNFLASLAGRKWNEGVSYQELENYLLDTNNHFSEPLDKAEVISVAKSISKYPRFNIAICTNEQDFSNQVVEKIKGQIIYVLSLGFYSNNCDIWEQDKEGLMLQERVKELVIEACKQLELIASNQKDKRLAGHILSLRGKLKKKAFQKNCIEMLKSSKSIVLKTDELDKHEHLIGMSNGVFDLSTQMLLDSAGDKFVTKSFNTSYDPNAACPLFDALLARLFPEQEEREYVLKVLAYAMSGEADLHEFYIMVGSGANGKSTLMELINYMMGSYSVSLDPNSFVRKQNSSINNDIAALRGTRLCLTSETANGAVLDVALIKRLVGGDTISARLLFQEFFEFQNKAIIFMLTNFMPIFDGGDGGFKRRVRIIPFNVVIPEEEQDPKLSSKLKKEASGIFNRLLSAYQAFQTEGLKMPPRFKKATEKFCEQSDLIKQFFDDHMVYDPESEVSVSKVHHLYRVWAESRLYKPLSSNPFSMAFESHTKLERGRTAAGMVWKGVKVASHPAMGNL